HDDRAGDRRRAGGRAGGRPARPARHAVAVAPHADRPHRPGSRHPPAAAAALDHAGGGGGGVGPRCRAAIPAGARRARPHRRPGPPLPAGLIDTTAAIGWHLAHMVAWLDSHPEVPADRSAATGGAAERQWQAARATASTEAWQRLAASGRLAEEAHEYVLGEL